MNPKRESDFVIPVRGAEPMSSDGGLAQCDSDAPFLPPLPRTKCWTQEAASLSSSGEHVPSWQVESG
jgi:hypothetical protein